MTPNAADPADPDDPDRSRGATRFVRLLTQNERRVYAFILSLVPNWADADEILQETNVRLWNEFAKFDPDSDFLAWACTVARFQVLTHRKRQSREKLKFTDEFLDVVADAMTRDDDQTAARYQALQGCIDGLSEGNREMLKAYYRHGAAGADVAAAFGRSLDALYKTLSRIRRTLHECVESKLNIGVRA